MPVQMDSSIVPDSTLSSSPIATPSVVKRVRRMYGRSTNKEAAGEDTDTPHLLHLSKSSSSIDSILRTGPLDVDEEVPPSSDPSYEAFNQADDDDDEADSEDASSAYQFSWKKKLRDIDMEEDNDADMAGVSEVKSTSKQREEGDTSALSPQRHESPDFARLTSFSVEKDNDALTETVFNGSLSTLPNSSPAAHSSFGRTPSPQVTNRRRRKKPTRHDSGSEAGESKESTPTTPSHPHPLTTPKSRSSPTPPTSDDDMPTLLGQDKKGKGKGKAPGRPDVAPLCFSEASVVTRSFQKQKASEDQVGPQAPTKKELKETARNRLRIAADQQVSIPRTEAVTSKYTIQGLFEAIVPKRPEIEVDPIADFSSECHTSPVILHISPSPPALRQSDGSPLKPSLKHAQSSPLGAMRSLPDLINNSDEDFPEVAALVEKDEEAQNSLKRQQQLFAIKQRALEMQANAGPVDSEDDDDELQIVQTADMQMMIKEEEADRRSGRKKQVSEGRKMQLNLGGIDLTRRNAKDKPLNIHDLELLQRAGVRQRKKGDPQMTPNLLAQIVHSRADVARRDIIRAKEEEWVQRGGQVKKQDDGTSVQDVSKLYDEKGLNLPGGTAAGMGLEEDSDGDDNWSPELSSCLGGSASPSPTHGSESENEDTEEEEGTNSMVNDHDYNNSEEEEELDIRLPLRTRRPVLKTFVDSDDEDVASRSNPRLQNTDFKEHGISRQLNLEHRGSMSSLEDRTENEEDKENETSRMFDRGEDKENKAVVRHVPLDDKVPLGARKSPLFGLGRGHARRLSRSPAHRADDENNTLKELIDEDPFASPPRPSKLPQSFEARLKLASPTVAQPSTAPLNLTPFIGNEPKPLAFSQFLDEPSAVIVSAPSRSGFSDFFDSGTENQEAPTTTEQSTGSVDKAFPSDRLVRADALDLTQDITLQPAFEVSGTFLRKADQIFEKEQEYVFLTQTRPNVSTPEIYRRPSPTPAQVLSQSQSQLTSRRPLRTITLTDEVDFESPAPLGRLHKRAKELTSPLLGSLRSSPSLSPTTKRSVNAFDILKRGFKAQVRKFQGSLLDKSEFIEQEAQESDDDEIFGFGPRLKDKDDEENEEDLDQTLETLVDDAEMDEKILAADLVMEKYKEHEKEDDEALHKLHEAVTHGEMRKKRKNRGLGMEDSDDESDEDERSRRIRHQMHKKQRIDRSNIKELGEHEETRSFFNVYQQNLVSDDADFAYLKESQPLDIVMGNTTQDAGEGPVDEAKRPLEVLTTTEFTKLVRETAQKARTEEEDETLDPNDISWMDDNQSDDDNNVRVKSVALKAKKHSSIHRKAPEQTEFDVGFEPSAIPIPKTDIAERSIKWAKIEGRSDRYGTTGRNVGGAAVTGHQAKSGKPVRNGSGEGFPVTSTKSESRRQVKADNSVILKMAADTRTTRFG
ncbi:hypothetical protein C0992_003289 [Termitomyces sp. T32_za158]|nr:hypothetical protein C0992_003289 [Termitomyces sp. T32_za158]